MEKGRLSLIIFSLLSSRLVLGFSLPISAPHAILMDYHSGAVLFEKQAHEKMVPSSLTKIMTLYLAFEAIKGGTIALDQTFYVSKKARSQPGSRMFVEEGSFVTMEDLIQGTVVSSGNDSSIVIAEGLAGDESVFALQMTERAQDLGAKNTHFLEAHGLPKKGHYTTAYDLAMISSSLIREFPKLYDNYFSMVKYKYNDIEQYTHNSLLRQSTNQGDYTVDGLKTGYTVDGGYGLVFSAVKGGTRILGVINGCESHEDRIREARTMLQWGFHQNKTMQLMSKGVKAFSLPLKGGQDERVPVMSKEDIFFTYPIRVGKDGLNFRLKTVKRKAPVVEGDHIADVYIEGGLVSNQKIPLYAAAPVAQQSLFSSLFTWFSTLFGTPVSVSEAETLKLVRSSLLYPSTTSTQAQL